jgi:hypothetical protein
MNTPSQAADHRQPWHQPASTSTAASVEQAGPDIGDLHKLIEMRAYELFEARGSQHGNALDDWLQAEREMAGELAVGQHS